MQKILHVNLKKVKEISPCHIPAFLKKLREYTKDIGWKVKTNKNNDYKSWLEINGMMDNYDADKLLHLIAIRLS